GGGPRRSRPTAHELREGETDTGEKKGAVSRRAWVPGRHDGPLLEGRCSQNGYGANDAACRATKSRALVAGLPRSSSTSWVRRSYRPAACSFAIVSRCP